MHKVRIAVLSFALFAVACTPADRPAAQAPASLLAPDTSWVRRAGIYQVFVTDYSPGGNFQGVIDGLDSIEAAGADVLWLMPIHPIGVRNRKGTLGSPYSVRDFRGINPAFGTADDFRALVEAVHARGMKLILDWVPDHTAWDHAWITDHPEYYRHDSTGAITVPIDREGHLTDWTDVAQLDYRVPALRQVMIGEMRYWLDDFGVDGFRVDVAGFIVDDYWPEAIGALRAAESRPLLFLAEWGDPAMHTVGFDLTYGWDGYRRIKAVWQGASAAAFVDSELADTRGLPAGGMRLRFTTNHDQTAWENPPLLVFGGSAAARAAFVATALLPGRPMLYNGQEVESPQKLGLFEPQAIMWNQPHAAEARAFYARVLTLARTDSAFIGGPMDTVTISVPNDVVAYRRGDALVLANARNRAQRVGVTGFAVEGATDLLSGRAQRGDTVSLPAYGAVVLARRSLQP